MVVLFVPTTVYLFRAHI